MTAHDLSMTARPWRPAPSIRVSAALHVAGAAAVAAFPEIWPAVGAALAGNHLTLAGAGLWPRSDLLGPNLVRLPDAAARRGEVALTFDDGPDPEITPRVLDLLEAYGARASFFCVGAHAARHPALAREIVRRGHSIENHSERHSIRFGWYGLGRLRREIDAAQRTLADITGRAPAFFRAPFGLRNALLDPALARLGLRYVSWTRRGFDTVDADTARVQERLTKGLAGGDILMLHDGMATGVRRGPATTLAVLAPLLASMAAAGVHSVPLPAACSDGPAV